MTPPAPLSAEGRAVLRALGGWSIADLLLDPDAGGRRLRESVWGGTGLAGFPDGTGFQCEKRGIVVTHHKVPTDAHDSDGFITAEGMARIVRTEIVVVTWAQVARFVRAMPPDVRDQLRAARAAHQTASMWWRSPRFARRFPRRELTPPQRIAEQRALLTMRVASAHLEEALAIALPVADPAADESVQLDILDMVGAW